MGKSRPPAPRLDFEVLDIALDFCPFGYERENNFFGHTRQNAKMSADSLYMAW